MCYFLGWKPVATVALAVSCVFVEVITRDVTSFLLSITPEEVFNIIFFIFELFLKFLTFYIWEKNLTFRTFFVISNLFFFLRVSRLIAPTESPIFLLLFQILNIDARFHKFQVKKSSFETFCIREGEFSAKP